MPFVNLLADLRGHAFETAGVDGYVFSVYDRADDATLAWIDETFGGTWSSEAYAGKTLVARRGSELAGFAAYDARGLQFSWLRAWSARPGVGIFGPFGVAPAHRGSGIGPALLRGALHGLQREGYAHALIPAVGDDKLIRYYTEHANAAVVEEFDRAQWTNRRIRTTVLASGGGTNFQAVADAAAAGKLPLDLAAVVANKPGAFVLERAADAEIPNRILCEWDRKVESRQTYDARLLHAVRQTQPELVLLLGWMHLLPESFIAAFAQTINIHPAFLPLDQSLEEVGLSDGTTMPAFRGAHAIRDALAAGSAWIGATSHKVSLSADRGAVLTRKPLKIEGVTSETQALERLRPVEHRVLLGGIMRWVYER